MAEVVVTEEVEYFNITGTSKRSIMRSLQKNSPSRNGNNFAAATTRTQMSYEVTTQKRAGRCDVIKAKVLLHLTYTYPRLAQTPDKRTARWWQNELKSYEEHELTHGDIAKQYADRLDRKLLGTTNLRCSEIKGEIDRTFNYYKRKMQQAQDDFDRREKLRH